MGQEKRCPICGEPIGDKQTYLNVLLQPVHNDCAEEETLECLTEQAAHS